MKRGKRIREDALRRYFVYRMKLMELMHFHILWKALNEESFIPENVMDHRGSDFAASVRAASLGWFCTIVDQSGGGLNVFKLWRELFPKHRKEIDLAWKEIEPQWEVLKGFRDKCAFHADTPRSYFGAKQKMLDNPQGIKAVQKFLDLAIFFIRKEDEELPEFVPVVEEFLLSFELEFNAHVRRDAFKRTLILPRGNFHKVFST